MKDLQIIKACLSVLAVLQYSILYAGTPTIYTDESVFDGLWPGLDIETFEEATVGNGTAVPCNSPITSISSDDCFQPGEILQGLAISDLPGPTDGDIVVFGAGFSSLPSKMVAPNKANDRLNIAFEPAVFQVGFNLHTWGAGDPDTPTVRLYDESDSLIAEFDANSSISGDFLGIDSPQAIARIEVQSAALSPEAIDDLRFGPKDLSFLDGFEATTALP